MKDKNGIEIRELDRIMVPDNPDITPWDIGRVIRNNDELWFVGKFSTRPMSFYEEITSKDHIWGEGNMKFLEVLGDEKTRS